MADLIKQFPNLPAAVQQAIMDGPAMAPPDGVVPNFFDPPNKNAAALALGIICVSVLSMVVLCRIYVRSLVVKTIQLEDYLGLLAFAGYIALAWVYFQVRHLTGFYVHLWNIQFKTVPHWAKLGTFGLTITYSVTMLFTKIAILLEWVRIFAPNRIHRVFWWTSHVLIVLNIIFYVTSIIAFAVTCIPHESIWYPWIEGKCIDRRALVLSTSFSNVITDVVILLLPQRIIWTMHMKLSRRIGISLVFSAGLLAILCACGRLFATFGIKYTADEDVTWSVSPVLMWTLPEATCALLVFCLPTVPKAFTDKSALSKLAQSIHSWTRLSTLRSVPPMSHFRESDNKGWKELPTEPSRSQLQVNHKLDSEAGISRLTELHSLPSLQIQAPHHGRNPVILRTTEIELHADAASKISGDDLMERQHPWMAR